jgi:hypothetical protein
MKIPYCTFHHGTDKDTLNHGSKKGARFAMVFNKGVCFALLLLKIMVHVLTSFKHFLVYFKVKINFFSSLLGKIY